MSKENDTIKVELISNEYSVQKTTDNIIVIEQKSKKEIEPSFIESPIALSFIVPLILLLISFFLARTWFQKKEKKEQEKLDSEVSKLNEEIKQIKSSFQPIVLSTIQATQDKLLQDKIDALKEVVKLRNKLYSVEQFYINGEPFIEEEFTYFQSIYLNVSSSLVKELEGIVAEKGYYFPNIIIETLNLILFELNQIYDIQKREFSKQIQEMPDDAEIKVKQLAGNFKNVIDLIRENLKINNDFVDKFIEKYNDLED